MYIINRYILNENISLRSALTCAIHICCNKCERVCQKQVSKAWTSNYIPQYLWDVIICPCPRCLPQDLHDVGWLYQQTNSCAVVFVIDCVCEEVSMPTQGAPAECCNKNHGIKRTVTFSCTTWFCNEFQVSSFWHISHNQWLYWRLSISNLIIS